jgi:hypothetical protein
MAIFQRDKVLNAMTRSSSRRTGANRLTPGGPRSHGDMVNSTTFPELGHVAAGSATAKATGATQGIATLTAFNSGRSRRGC